MKNVYSPTKDFEKVVYSLALTKRRALKSEINRLSKLFGSMEDFYVPHASRSARKVMNREKMPDKFWLISKDMNNSKIVRREKLPRLKLAEKLGVPWSVLYRYLIKNSIYIQKNFLLGLRYEVYPTIRKFSVYKNNQVG